MEKEFIPYTLALALKELGFDEECFWWYDFEKQLRKDIHGFNTNSKYFMGGSGCSAPLYQQAFRWFREKHNINTVISWRDDLLNFDISLTEMKKHGYFYYKDNFTTYEEAELACLKKLIDLTKD